MKFVNARQFNTLFPQYFDNSEKEWEDYKRMIKSCFLNTPSLTVIC